VENNIIVQISAWRDPFIINTILSAYNSAANKDELVFGCVFQGYEEDRWMIEKINSLGPEVRLIWIDAETAPLSLTKIRGDIAITLVQDERYFLQVDSHTKFAPNWDLHFINELEEANKKFGKSILGGYIPTIFTDWNEDFKGCLWTAEPDEDWFKIYGGPIMGRQVAKQPVQTLEKFICAGHLFGETQFLRDVPQSDNILFKYEQPMMMLRAYTGGYNVVGPSGSYLCGFDYEHADKDSYVKHSRYKDPRWNSLWGKKEEQDHEYFKSIFLEKIYHPKNGALTKRSIEDYISFIGYDPVTCKLI
jgi:Glycosyltransferase (GlcNAc)